MTPDWYPGIRAFCVHWQHAPMLQETFACLEREFAGDSDACIDAAKGFVECACRIIIDEIDDPARPLKPMGTDVNIGELVGVATRLLKLGDVRHRKFADLVKHHNSLTKSLRELRNEAGTVSHGKDGFLLKLSAHHRRAAILSADAIVTFLFESYLERVPEPLGSMEPYERFAEANTLIDDYTSLDAKVDDEGALSITVRLPDGDEFPIAVEASKFLFLIDRQGYKQALDAARDASSRSPVVDEAK